METEIKLCECGCGGVTPLYKRTRSDLGYVKGRPLHFIRGHGPHLNPPVVRTHGFCPREGKAPEYQSFCNAKNRCTNPNCPRWEDYGGRGIKFLFTSFEQFFAHIGPRPEGTTLDRIENDGHYEVGNVRWATPAVQVANQRKKAA